MKLMLLAPTTRARTICALPVAQRDFGTFTAEASQALKGTADLFSPEGRILLTLPDEWIF